MSLVDLLELGFLAVWIMPLGLEVLLFEYRKHKECGYLKYIELVNRIEKIEDKSQELVSYPYINEFRIPQLDEFLNR